MNDSEYERVEQWIALITASHSRQVVNIAMFSVSSHIAMLTFSTLCDRRTVALHRKIPSPGRVVYALVHSEGKGSS
jgi:hypothetical protein